MSELFMKIPWALILSSFAMAQSLWSRYKGKQFDAIYYLIIAFMASLTI